MKILKVCSNCKNSTQLGYKEYHCPIFDYEVNWCGTCKNHELLDIENKEGIDVPKPLKGKDMLVQTMENGTF